MLHLIIDFLVVIFVGALFIGFFRAIFMGLRAFGGWLNAIPDRLQRATERLEAKHGARPGRREMGETLKWGSALAIGAGALFGWGGFSWPAFVTVFIAVLFGASFVGFYFQHVAKREAKSDRILSRIAQGR